VSDESRLVEWITGEQEALWSDLVWAINDAANGAWSMACSGLARRILESARLVGPISHERIPGTIVAGGVYGAVLHAGGFDPAIPDDAEWKRIEDLYRRTGGYLDHNEEIERFAATRHCIAADPDLAGAPGHGTAPVTTAKGSPPSFVPPPVDGWYGMQSSCPEGCLAEVRLLVRSDAKSAVIKTDRIALVHNDDGSHTVTLIPF
jgi:hypothetical protein